MRSFGIQHVLALDIVLESHVLYLAGSTTPSIGPFPAADVDTQNPSTPLRGTLRLNLPRPRSLDELRIVLVGTSTTPRGKTTTLRHEVDLLYDHSPSFAAGSHNLDFAILLPATLPPSLSCSYGSQSYTVRAFARPSDTTSAAAAFALLQSKPREVELVAAGLDDEYREDLVDITSFNPAVGPFSARLASNEHTIGSKLHFALQLPSPPAGNTLVNVRLALVQTMRIPEAHLPHSDRVLSRSTRLISIWNSPQGLKLMEQDPGYGGRLRPWTAGEEISFECYARIPSHEHFAASTPKHCKGGISVSHAVQLCIRYRLPDGNIKELQISRDIHLLSCKCMADTTVPPPYAKAKSSISIFKHLRKELCTCTVAAQQPIIQSIMKPRVVTQVTPAHVKV